MFYFLMTWNSLLVTTSAIGFYSLKPFRLNEHIPYHQSAIAIFWLGLALQCLLLLLLGTMIPIGAMLGVLLIIIVISEFLLHTRLKKYSNELSWTRFFSPIFHILRIPLLFCEIVFAILLLKPMTWFDTGLYHLGLIRWLSQYGLVPGLALINRKLGFVSSWFAFSAPLTPEFLGDHIGAVSNGFLLVLGACTVLLIFYHWKQTRQLTFEDTFLSVFLITLSGFYLAVWGAGESILLSFSHDLAVNYSVGFFAWMILLLSRIKVAPKIEHSEYTKTHFSDKNFPILFNINLLPLVMAFCILSFKLTGIFLIPIAYLFFVSQHLGSWKRWLMASLVSIVLILPLAIAQLVTSGCFLYPAQTFCLALPWTVPSDLIDSEAAPIIGEGFFGFLTDGFTPALLSTWHSVREAFIGNMKVRISALLLVALTASVIWRIFNRRKTPSGELWVLATAIGGSLFIFLLNKYVIFRFGGGIVLLLPTYFLSIFIYKFLSSHYFSPEFDAPYNAANKPLRFPKSWLQPGHQFLNLTMLGILAIAIATNLTALSSHILVPPSLPQAHLLPGRVNDVRYTLPEDWTLMCWNADLPCSPNPLSDIRLRNPRKGLGGGFMLFEHHQ